MCNNYANHVPVSALFDAFSQTRTPLRFDGGPPNLAPQDDIRPTDVATVILGDEAGARLARMRWGLLPQASKRPPVINYRSEGRDFRRGRCLVPASAFFEFTGTKYPKTRWRFSRDDRDWFCFAGFSAGEGEEARFALLTCPPGPDIAALHDRQPVTLLSATAAADWLAGEPAAALLTPSPAGTWRVEPAPRG